MAAAGLCCRLSVFRFTNRRTPACILPLGITQDRFYAKRVKGKNTPRKKPLKRDVSQEQKGWLTNKVDKTVFKLTREEIESAYEPAPVDNVWLVQKHRPPLFNTNEVLRMHRESHHPTIYNEPDGKVYATLELDMKLAGSKYKILEAFRGVFCYPNHFNPDQSKRILAICTDEKLQEEALKSGAVLSGGLDIIRKFRDNELSHEDFDHVVVHPDMLMEIISIRGMLRHHFPTKQRGNLGINVAELVQTFFKGVDYKSVKDVIEQQYSTVDVLFGTLSMQDKALEENLAAILLEINMRRSPGVDTPFILSVNVWSPPSPEKLFVNFWKYLSGYEQNEMLCKYTTVNFQSQ